MAAGHTAAAIGRYRRAIALEPEWASPLMSLGALISRSEHWDEALPWLDSAVAVDPSSSYSYTVRAMVRAAAGDTAGTRGDAERALRLATGYRVPALAARALAAATAGDQAAAARWADSAARAIPDPANLSANDAFYVSLAFVQAGDRPRALQVLERGPANAWLWFYTSHPLLNVLRDDPGFLRLRAGWEPPGV
jgi:tetratricopeptide (TPR) repeat protein